MEPSRHSPMASLVPITNATTVLRGTNNPKFFSITPKSSLSFSPRVLSSVLHELPRETSFQRPRCLAFEIVVVTSAFISPHFPSLPTPSLCFWVSPSLSPSRIFPLPGFCVMPVPPPPSLRSIRPPSPPLSSFSRLSLSLERPLRETWVIGDVSHSWLS